MWACDMNGEKTPDNIGGGSDEIAWFRCTQNPTHLFQKKVSKMTSGRDGHNIGCIYCGPNAKIPFPGETDLFTVIPQAKKMWDFDKNELDPLALFPLSAKRAYFKCRKGHIEERKIADFSRSPECPECTRQNTLLINNAIHTKDFWDSGRNTIPMDSLIQSDTCFIWLKCPKCGYEWNCRASHWNKHRYCACCGFNGKGYHKVSGKIVTIRMKNPDIVQDWDYENNGVNTPDNVLAQSNVKIAFKCRYGHGYKRVIGNALRKEDNSLVGCPYCDTRKKTAYPGETDLFAVCPPAEELWDYEANTQNPEGLSPNSLKVCSFRCGRGHRFEKRVRDFIKSPTCSECDWIDHHCIISQRPEIVRFWRECNILPLRQVSTWTPDVVSWECPDCGYIWKQSVTSMAKGKGVCPACTNNFRNENPEAAALWVQELNNGLTPDNTSRKSGRAIHMRCRNNHIYESKVVNIPDTEPFGCPYCTGRRVIPGETDLFTICRDARDMWDYEANTGYDLLTVNPRFDDKVMWICGNGHHFEQRIRLFVKKTDCPDCQREKAVVAQYPQLVRQWNFKKNKGIDVNLTPASSREEVWWRCKKCGYEWKSQIMTRKASKGLCPCCENRTIVAEGITDLFTMVPGLKVSYDFERNREIDIAGLSVTTRNKVWWKCPDCEHSWQSPPSARLKKQGDEYVIRGCAVCLGVKRVITYAEEYPDLAQRFAENLNHVALANLTGKSLNQNFWWHCNICGEDFYSSLSAMIRGRNTSVKGCPYCSGKLTKREKSFAALHPEVMDEYDPENAMDPYTVAEKSNLTAKWICRVNSEHRWNATFESRATGYGNCNICRIYQYKVMFHEEHPDFRVFYDAERNERPFESYSNMSNEAVWWLCPEGHSFSGVIMNISRQGAFKCPICDNRLVIPEVNSLASQYPELTEEYSERNPLPPEKNSIISSNTDIWWKCPHGHEFKKSPRERITHDTECPICSRRVVIPGINDFQNKYPKVSNVWDYDANPVKPDEFSDIHQGKFFFKCGLGHSYEAYLIPMIANDFECLVCKNKLIIEGANSLFDTDFDLAQEFSPNEERKPTEFSKDSSYSALWRCVKCGNDYHAPIKNRHIGDDSCPFCDGRYTQFGINSLVDTHEELAKQWSPNNESDIKRTRKESRSFAKWICPDCGGEYGGLVCDREVGDNACPYCNLKRVLPEYNSLAVTHKELAKEWSPNNIRSANTYLKDMTYTVLWICSTCHGEYGYPIRDREVGDDSCPYCRDKKVLPGFNSLAIRNSELAKQWSPNNVKTADMYIKSNSTSVLWICPNCHGEYGYLIKDRELGDDSCPYCHNRKVLAGFNSFADMHGDLLSEWNYINNYLLCQPTEILATYADSVWWICKICNRNYEMSPKRKIYFQMRHMKSCPYCKGLRPKKVHFF